MEKALTLPCLFSEFESPANTTDIEAEMDSECSANVQFSKLYPIGLQYLKKTLEL